MDNHERTSKMIELGNKLADAKIAIEKIGKVFYGPQELKPTTFGVIAFEAGCALGSIVKACEIHASLTELEET